MSSPSAGSSVYVKSEGTVIAESNYWGSRMAQNGALAVSVSANCIRVLVPEALSSLIPDMIKGASEAFLVTLKDFEWTASGSDIVFQFVMNDGSDTPWSFCGGTSSWIDDLVFKPGGFTAAIWGRENGQPVKYWGGKARLAEAPELPAF